MRITLKEYCCFYGELQACGPISFDLNTGQALAVRGINGAGKSSLLTSAAGFYPPKAIGTILFDGQTLPTETQARFHHHIALVPEGRHVFPDLTAEENLLVPAAHLPKAERKERLEAVLHRISFLREMRRRKAGLLSGGQQQLLAIGRALMAKPSVLLVDEPFLGLSPAAIEEVASLLSEEKAAGTTLIFTCQDDPQADMLADFALVLQCGRQIFFGPYKEGKTIPLMP